MPTVVTGVRGTGVLGDEDRRVRDVTPALAQLEPDAGPLITLLSRLKKRVATDPKIEWYEDELLPRFDLLAGALTAGATTMTVTNYKYFRKGDLVKVNKKEIVYVSATPTSTTVTITRAFGETVAAAASTNDQLWIIGNTNEEGATGRDIISTQRAAKFNYLQIFRDPFGFTRTQIGTKQFAGQDKDAEMAKQLIEHKKSIELSLWFGERAENTSGTHPKRTTRGVVKWISTNVKDDADLTETELEDFLRPIFRYGSKEKILFCSPKVIQVINSFGREKLQTRSDEKTYGITMTQYQNAGRKVMLVEHQLFTNDSLSDLTGVAGYGVCLDIQDLEVRYLQGAPLARLSMNIQANDVDGEQHEYISEVGLELHQERKHGLLTGVLG